MKRGRHVTWLDEYSFVDKYQVLVPKPQPCICGTDNYRYNFRKGKNGGHIALYSYCANCRSWSYFSPKRARWVYLIPGVYSSRNYE